MISIVHFTNHPPTIYSILYEKHVAANIKTKISFLLFLRFRTSMAYAFAITKIPWLMKTVKWATLCALERLCCEFFFQKQSKVNGSIHRFVIICKQFYLFLLRLLFESLIREILADFLVYHQSLIIVLHEHNHDLPHHYYHYFHSYASLKVN